jgi:hypothetical protein
VFDIVISKPLVDFVRNNNAMVVFLQKTKRMRTHSHLSSSD